MALQTPQLQLDSVRNPEFVTPNDKTPGDIKSDIGSEITYGEQREKNDEEIEHEQELASRWNIQSFSQLNDHEQQETNKQEEEARKLL